MENEPEVTIPNEHRERLIKVLEKLEQQIIKQNSLRNAFIKGIVYGLGTVFGASILVALFGGFIANTINIFTDEPVLNESLELDGQ